MSSVPWPQDQPEQWDTVVLGGFKLPGFGSVDVETSLEVTSTKVKGLRGETITRQGANACRLTIKLRMYTAEQLAYLQSLYPILRPNTRTVGGCSPISISHPKATLYGITEIQITKIVDNQVTEGFKTYDVTITGVENKPPVKTKVETKTDGHLRQQDNQLTGGKASDPKPPSASANVPPGVRK